MDTDKANKACAEFCAKHLHQKCRAQSILKTEPQHFRVHPRPAAGGRAEHERYKLRVL